MMKMRGGGLTIGAITKEQWEIVVDWPPRFCAQSVLR